MTKEDTGLTRVRTGPSSYLKLNDADLKAWKAAGNKEYGAAADTDAGHAPQATTDPNDTDAKAVMSPVENKARMAPVDTKRAR